MMRSSNLAGDQLGWYPNPQSNNHEGRVSSGTWPTAQENGYEDGGICQPSEDMPSAESNSRMLLMNVSVDEQLEVHGGAYKGAEPLCTYLHDLVDVIRQLTIDQKQRTIAPSENSSVGSASPTGPRGHRPSATALSILRLLRKGRPNTPGGPSSSSIGPSSSHSAVSLLGAGMKRQAPRDDDIPFSRSFNGEGCQDLPPATDYEHDAEQQDNESNDDSDPERKGSENLRTMFFADEEGLRLWYEACFKRIQQTACRQIAQVFVRVVHPKKQTSFPYNGNKRLGAGQTTIKQTPKEGYKSDQPGWWPAGVPHKEPAHMKTPERMELLIHILCNLQSYPGVGPRNDGVKVADLRAATDEDPAIRKMSKKVRHWLTDIYTVRKGHEEAREGCARQSVQVHYPSNRRVRKKNEPQRRKTNNADDRNKEAVFEEDPDQAPRSAREEKRATKKPEESAYEDASDSGSLPASEPVGFYPSTTSTSQAAVSSAVVSSLPSRTLGNKVHRPRFNAVKPSVARNAIPENLQYQQSSDRIPLTNPVRGMNRAVVNPGPSSNLSFEHGQMDMVNNPDSRNEFANANVTYRPPSQGPAVGVSQPVNQESIKIPQTSSIPYRLSTNANRGLAAPATTGSNWGHSVSTASDIDPVYQQDDFVAEGRHLWSSFDQRSHSIYNAGAVAPATHSSNQQQMMALAPNAMYDGRKVTSTGLAAAGSYNLLQQTQQPNLQPSGQFDYQGNEQAHMTYNLG